MDTPSIIREFLDENSIAAARSVEITYKYHAELEAGCRLTGCEIIMRAAGEDVFVRAELPISVMTKETRGVVKYLADLNKKRIEEGKQGYFDLDYVAGKIIFGIRVRQPITTALLKDVAGYCVDQIEYESDELLKAVCDECEAVLQEEEELRQQREKENREPSMFALLMRRLRQALRNKLDPDSAKKSGRRGLPESILFGDDEDDEEYDYYEPKDEEEEYKFERRTGEKTPAGEETEPVQPEAAEENDDSDRDFSELLKALGVTDDEDEETAGEDDPIAAAYDETSEESKAQPSDEPEKAPEASPAGEGAEEEPAEEEADSEAEAPAKPEPDEAKKNTDEPAE